jgi:hypothetical protein
MRYAKGFLLSCKILRQGASGFTSYLKEGVLQIFIDLKNPSLAIYFGNRTELLRRLHSNGIPRRSGNVVTQKRPGGGRLRMKQWRWERPGEKLRGWLTTEPDGKVSLMPYAPVGATGTN